MALLSLSARLRRTGMLALPLALSCALCFSLTGCQTPVQSGPLITDSNYWQGMQERLQEIKSLQLTGRVSLTYQSTRFSANFRYTTTAPQNYDLLLTTSMGVTIAHLTVTPSGATLQADSKTFTADNAQELFAQTVGIPLPLDDFQDIIIGRALEQSAFTPEGILYTTVVPNFQITYRNYMSLPAQSISLPNEIEVTGPELRLRVLTREVQQIEMANAATTAPATTTTDAVATTPTKI